MSHAEDSNNPHSLFLVSVTSLQAPQQLHFHLWLLWTPVTAGSAGQPESTFLVSPSSPVPPATENEEDSEVPLQLHRHRLVGGWFLLFLKLRS